MNSNEAACRLHAAQLSSLTALEETRAACAYHAALLSKPNPPNASGGETKGNAGGVWISRHPVVFVDAGGEKKENEGGV